MRSIHTLPMAAVFMLAACGGGEERAVEDPTEDAAEEVAAAVQVRPGEYRVSIEMLEFDAPDLPEAAKDRAQDIYASGLTSHTFCMTPDMVAGNAAEQMVKNMTDSECTTRSFNVSGGRVVSELQCAMDGGITSTTRIEGEITPNGSTMTIDSTQSVPGAGETSTTTRVTSERIGDCAA